MTLRSWFLCGLAAVVLLTACSPEPTGGDQDRRIVCLIPAVTRMIVDLGMADQVVGVGEHDALIKQGRPIVGHFAAVDTERLLSLRPDLVITLQSKDSPSDRLTELAGRGRFELIALPYPTGVAAVLDTLSHAGTEGSLGDVLGVPEQAAALRQQMIDRFDALRQRTSELEPVSVLLCFGLTPVMASGPGTVHDELLGYINATNAAGNASVTAPTFDREMLLAARPQVIVLLLPNAPPLIGPDDSRLAGLRGLNIPAVRDARIYLINDPACLLPSTNLPDLAEQLARVIHRLPVAEDGDD